MTIRLKLLFACATFVAIIFFVGLYSDNLVTTLSNLALSIYDEAFMGVNYAHKSQAVFIRFAKNHSDKPIVEEDRGQLEELVDNLDIAIERATSDKGRSIAQGINTKVAALQKLPPGSVVSPASLQDIDAEMTKLVDTYTADGFAYRTHSSELTVANRKTLIAVLCIAMGIAFLTTALLVRSIIPPLKRAVEVATAIGDGRLDNQIFAQGQSETSLLLNALAKMQIGIIGNLKRIEEETRKAEHEAQASATKSDFLANMSHEVRTPLNGVLGMANLLLDTKLDADQRSWASIIKKSGENLLEIINDILDVSKIESGKLKIESVNFDLIAMMREVTDILAVKAHEKKIGFHVGIEPGTPLYATGDPMRLRQILMNLLGNALKFTERGYVYMEVTGAPAADNRLYLQFAVKDTGIGIPQEKIKYIFDKFSQAEESTTRKYGGTGLGLAICNKLVEMMGGAITVESELGKGSTFRFDVLLGKGAAPADGPDAQIPACDLGGLRAIVIDDFQVSSDIIKRYLDAWKIQCDACLSSELAMTMMEQATGAGRAYHFAVIGHRPNGLNGMQLSERIKSSPFQLNPIMIMLAPFGPPIADDDLIRHGFSGIILKPFYPDQLKAALQLLWDARLNNKKIPLVARGVAASTAPAGDPENQAPETSVRDQGHKIQSGPFAGVRVLAVDDNKVNLMLLTKILQKQGCGVFPAMNGKDAAEMMRQNRYDIVFMDCQMPVMDGFEATRLIREEEAGQNRRTTIVAVTADAMTGDREKCLGVGMDDYLNKPVNSEQIVEMLQKWLGKDAA